MEYSVLKNIANHNAIQNQVTLSLWPEFMLHDGVANQYWGELFESFPEYQFSLESDGEIIGTGNCLPYRWDASFEELPERGWDRIFEKGIEDARIGTEPNTLNGLQIAVDKKHQGKGVSSLVLKEMTRIARDKGFKNVTIPVRPSLKSRYPLTPIDRYITWQREDNLPFDPWLRVHKRFGGRLVKPCHEAMHITGTIADWEEWTGMRFFETGQYIVPGALNPVYMDIKKDLGTYIEPNVWLLHQIS